MKRKLFLIFFTLIFIKPVASYCQQQFKVAYTFSKDKFSDGLYRIPDSLCDVSTGYIILNGKDVPFHTIGIKRSIKETDKKFILYKLTGLIDRRTDDTLFVHFNTITHETDAFKKDAKYGTYINANDNKRYFAYIMNWDSNNKFKVPFSYTTFTGTSIPYRFNLKTGMSESDFLDFNIAWYSIKGHTTFYKNPDIDPRNIYYGLGLFFGLKKIPDGSTVNDAFGTTYGATVLASFLNFNLIGSFGLENGFTKATSGITPYIGFGIGFNIVMLYDPTQYEM